MTHATACSARAAVPAFVRKRLPAVVSLPVNSSKRLAGPRLALVDAGFSAFRPARELIRVERNRAGFNALGPEVSKGLPALGGEARRGRAAPVAGPARRAGALSETRLPRPGRRVIPPAA